MANKQLIATKVIGALTVIAIGIACLHIKLLGPWIGLFIIVGALGEVLNALFRRSNVWQALAIYAVLFLAVYNAIPHLMRIGPHHWMPPW